MALKKQKKHGFTLIELLVVIAILGLLASIVLVAVNQSKIKARNVKRMGDVRQFQKALEFYFNSNNSYPSHSSSLTGFDIQDYRPFLVPTFLGAIPNDPMPLWNNYKVISFPTVYSIFVPFGNDGGTDCIIYGGNFPTVEWTTVIPLGGNTPTCNF